MSDLRVVEELDAHGMPVLMGEEPVEPEPAPPASLTTVEELRKGDAIREAAREFERLSVQDLKERFKGVTTRDLTDDELAEIQVEVREQELNDLLDILDQLKRGKLRGRRMVRMTAPKGYYRKMIYGLSPAEIDQIRDRLIARGWSAEDVTSGFDSRLSPKQTKDDSTLS